MKVKVKERVNWPITILLILGLVTVIFPLYLTVVIAFKKPFIPLLREKLNRRLPDRNQQ